MIMVTLVLFVTGSSTAFSESGFLLSLSRFSSSAHHWSVFSKFRRATFWLASNFFRRELQCSAASSDLLNIKKKYRRIMYGAKNSLFLFFARICGTSVLQTTFVVIKPSSLNLFSNLYKNSPWSFLDFGNPGNVIQLHNIALETQRLVLK